MWWKLDSQIDNSISYYSGVAAGYEFLLNGVTTVIDHHASGTDILGSLKNLNKGLDVVGLRKILCFETSDRFDVNKCIKENISFADKNQNEFTSGLFGMHASMSLSDSSLKQISKKINGLPIHIHVAESKMDVEDCEQKYGLSICERLDKYNLISPDSLIVHGVHLAEKDVGIVVKNGGYMVINPTSNLNNAVGIPDVKMYLNSGAKVMIGNDGLSSSMTTEYLNTYYLTHLKNESPTAMGLDKIIEMIENAYDYVGRRLNINIGKIKPTYVSDFMLIDYNPFTKVNKDNMFGHMFFGLFPNFKPTDVYVNGKRLVKNGAVTSPKLKREFKKSKESSEILWERVKSM